MSEGITRLAPSPTGALHLGNARTFLLNYLLGRQRGWKVLMRVEDLDGPRIKAGAAEQALDELRWLGLEWEGEIVYQSTRHLIYLAALEQLAAIGAVYPCTCSRKDIELAGAAPHDDEGVALYPGTCRGRWASGDHAAKKSGRPVAWRVHVRDEIITFNDAFAGEQNFNLARTCGDFVVFRGDNLAAYQLAVVLDDADARVDQIVRGDDLLESAARQIHLRQLLGLPSEVNYYHLPLVVGEDGRRLAKRHGDTRLVYYRQRGVAPQRVLGLLGYWSGLIRRRRDAELPELLEKFVPSRIPPRRVVFKNRDDRFLLKK
ncbi:MAG: tRNA glutamyl-Q(34) synthetase GluQRS [Planctomycetota bacterium]